MAPLKHTGGWGSSDPDPDGLLEAESEDWHDWLAGWETDEQRWLLAYTTSEKCKFLRSPLDLSHKWIAA
eukprot:SAG11_NODE_3141_length_2658_cov_1.249707_2_plen_69_part_00